MRKRKRQPKVIYNPYRPILESLKELNRQRMFIETIVNALIVTLVEKGIVSHEEIKNTINNKATQASSTEPVVQPEHAGTSEDHRGSE